MSILQSLRKVLRRNSELNDELQSHLRMAIADSVARGESPEGEDGNLYCANSAMFP